jgi:hypothetical protein
MPAAQEHPCFSQAPFVNLMLLMESSAIASRNSFDRICRSLNDAPGPFTTSLLVDGSVITVRKLADARGETQRCCHEFLVRSACMGVRNGAGSLLAAISSRVAASNNDHHCGLSSSGMKPHNNCCSAIPARLTTPAQGSILLQSLAENRMDRTTSPADHFK